MTLKNNHTSVPHKGKVFRTNESYRNTYQDLPTVIGLTIPKMEYLLRRTIRSVLVWIKHWKGEL